MNRGNTLPYGQPAEVLERVLKRALGKEPMPAVDEKRDDLAMPEGLSELGQKAHAVIVDLLRKRGLTYTGGGRAFASPAEWEKRNEKYGKGSVLIILGGDGSSVGHVYNYDCFDYPAIEALTEALEPLGLYVEDCTGSYGAVYPTKPPRTAVDVAKEMRAMVEQLGSPQDMKDNDITRYEQLGRELIDLVLK